MEETELKRMMSVAAKERILQLTEDHFYIIKLVQMYYRHNNKIMPLYALFREAEIDFKEYARLFPTGLHGLCRLANLPDPDRCM
ncbi:MAG: TusE/DsrC/DsvC family sulfur relay protein [Candidatus Kapabacteria bacterium]|nr:TusE/DsrC/DsvC family sulfur relay protein [Candidatus Kapabacteria bacterium]